MTEGLYKKQGYIVFLTKGNVSFLCDISDFLQVFKINLQNCFFVVKRKIDRAEKE